MGSKYLLQSQKKDITQNGKNVFQKGSSVRDVFSGWTIRFDANLETKDVKDIEVSPFFRKRELGQAHQTRKATGSYGESNDFPAAEPKPVKFSLKRLETEPQTFSQALTSFSPKSPTPPT